MNFWRFTFGKSRIAKDWETEQKREQDFDVRMKLSEFGRKNTVAVKTKSAKEVEAGRRLEQVITRLQTALNLGWDLNERRTSKREKATKWVCPDLSVQAQVSRALLGFAECVATQFPVVEKNQVWRQKLQLLLVEVRAALEALLISSSSTVRSKSSTTTEILAVSVGNHWGKAPIHLLPPLSTLLDDADEATARSAGKAMEHMLHRLRIWERSSDKEANYAMWLTLAELDPLVRIEQQLQKSGGVGGTAGGIAGSTTAVLLGVLEGLLLRWSVAKAKIDGDLRWWQLVVDLCENKEDDIAKAALHCAATMVGECRTTSHLADKVRDLWRAVSVKLRMVHHVTVKDSALQLLTVLPTAPKFEVVFQETKEWESIAKSCVKALVTFPEPFPPGMPWTETLINRHLITTQDSLRRNALLAICALLRWPGDHHHVFLQVNLLDALVDILRGRTVVGEGKDGKEGKEGRQNPRLRLLAWQAMAWIGTHSGSKYYRRSHSKGVSNGNSSGGVLNAAWIEKVAALLCGTFCRLFHRSSPSVNFLELGSNHVSEEEASSLLPPGHEASPQEVMYISRAAYAFIVSRNEALSGQTKKALEVTLCSHGRGWISSLVRQLSAHRSNSGTGTPADNASHVALLTAVSVLFSLPSSFMELINAEIGKVLICTIKDQVGVRTVNKSESFLEDSDEVEMSKFLRTDSGVTFDDDSSEIEEYFGRPIEDWEGEDSVLFSALRALVELFRNQADKLSLKKDITVAGVQNQNIGSGLFAIRPSCNIHSTPEVGDELLQEAEKLLLELAGDTFAPGIRWNAVEARAFLGKFGFPGIVGECIQSVFNDPTRADVVFQFNTGERLHVHLPILASRSPSLLSAFVSKGSQAALTAGKLRDDKDTARSKYSEKEIQSSPLLAHVSARFSYAVFRSVLEFVYTGFTVVPNGDVTDVAILARKCGLQPLTKLLQKEMPEWGERVAPCDLSGALSPAGWPFRDAVLYTGEANVVPSIEGGETSDCTYVGPHVHVHKVILEARCEYLAALFRSGMRDSVSGLVFVPEVTIVAVTGLVRFFYTGRLSFERLRQACDSESLGKLKEEEKVFEGVSHFSAAMQLAQLAESWMMPNLQECCWDYVLKRLRFGNALHVLQEGSRWRQWGPVEAAVECVAPAYLELRDREELDCLSEELREAIREAHVKLLTM